MKRMIAAGEWAAITSQVIDGTSGNHEDGS